MIVIYGIFQHSDKAGLIIYPEGVYTNGSSAMKDKQQ